MANEKQYFEWMKIRKKYHTIGGILDIPTLILLWYLGYETSFWIILIILILAELGYCSKMKELSNQAGMKGSW